LGGLKKGSGTTFAETVCRTASTVISVCSEVPGPECSRPTEAGAIIFFKVGDHVVEVAFPTCRRVSLYDEATEKFRASRPSDGLKKGYEKQFSVMNGSTVWRKAFLTG